MDDSQDNTVANPHWAKQYTRERSQDLQDTLAELKLHLDVGGTLESRAVVRESAIAFAQLAFKNLVLINGGALVALPILLELDIQHSNVLFSAAFFSIGLCL